jgi:tetratricopeptide (TPR) repeat protein
MMLPAFLLGAMLSAVPAQVEAQFDEVGSITFPTSATGEAQQHFLRGVAILHSFGWKQARAQFHAAQELDPDFAMAYWGESLAYNHPLVSQMDPTEPRKALERLGATPAERLAKAPTDREKGFMKAVEILWSEKDHVDRRVGYMEAMRDLYEAYPEDPEISAFYALSLLSATAATRDLSQRWNVMAGAIALRLFNDNPMHPGAAHYTIHSFDNPIMAPLALDAAYAFADIAPAVSHARHMPTHIFIQHGMWDLVSGHNQSAYDVAVELWEPGDALGDAVHSLDWGQYGDLQRGDYAKARLWIERIESMVEHEGFEAGGARGVAGAERARGAVPLLKSRYTVETEEWDVRPVTEDMRTNELLATGLSAARTGDQETLAAAEKALAEESDGSGYDHVMHMQISALLHHGMGHADMATDFMDKAVEAVEAMAPPRGSANPVKPVHELYGELLLELDRPEDAAEMFETSLMRMAGRPRSLLGLARANAAMGNTMVALENYSKVAALWEGRDGIAGLAEARGFVEEQADGGGSSSR